MKSFRSYFSLTWLCLCALTQRLSADPLDQWISRTSGTTNGLSAVTYGNGTFAAVGALGTIVTSPDGVRWTTRTFGTSSGLSAVTYGNGTFVAVGFNSWIFNGTILTSPDGVIWTNRSSGTIQALVAVSYGNGTFVVAAGRVIAAASGERFLLTSSDGIHWNRGSVAFDDVTYGNGTFVAVGTVNRDPFISPLSVGTIATSPDGFDWRTVFSLQSGETCNGCLRWWTKLDRVVYVNGTFFALGGRVEVYPLLVSVNPFKPISLTSTDGVHWKDGGPGVFSALTYGNGTFVAVGPGDQIKTSPDGVNWTIRTHEGTSSVSTPNLTGVTYGNGTFVAVGDRGAILQTPMLNPLWLELLPNRLIQINVAAAPGKNYGIQASTNLVDWLLLTNLVSTDATVQFIDFGATNFSRRFYRAVLP